MEIPGSKSGKLLKGSLSVTYKMERLVRGSHFHLVSFAPELTLRLVGLREGKVQVRKEA